MSNCLWPHGLQHTRPPCPSPLPELAQTHVHRVGDAIQPSHPLSNSPALNLSQHQCLFWVSSSHQVAKLLELQLQHLNIQDWFESLGWTGLSSLQSKGLSSLFQHHSSKSINSSALSFLYDPTLTSIHDHWKNHSFDYTDLCQQTNVSAF